MLEPRLNFLQQHHNQALDACLQQYSMHIGKAGSIVRPTAAGPAIRICAPHHARELSEDLICPVFNADTRSAT